LASLFGTPRVAAPPQEDPSVKAARDAEAARAAADKTKATQQQLGLETQQRNTGFGVRSLLGVLGSGSGRGGLSSLLGSG
jgi:hypothetical protein